MDDPSSGPSDRRGGNVIVLHGIGFHALQTLILPAWLLEKAQISESFKKDSFMLAVLLGCL